MSLERFRTAQDSRHGGFETALAELKAGRKRSHWIWYVFPQLAGLGNSSPARTYALRDLNEAVEYRCDPVLGPRLAAITDVVARQLASGVGLEHLMGSHIDALKLVSSLTLFELALQGTGAAPPPYSDALAKSCASVLAAAEREGFPRCRFSLEQARPAGETKEDGGTKGLKD
ncbi:MAG: DUF1810 family protein [Opitutaceae bacterium]|nr:DUF1810 family protein [Opitutaceae bacterium]